MIARQAQPCETKRLAIAQNPCATHTMVYSGGACDEKRKKTETKTPDCGVFVSVFDYRNALFLGSLVFKNNGRASHGGNRDDAGEEPDNKNGK